VFVRCLIAVAIVVAARGAVAQERSGGPPDQHWRQAMYCGPNSLYLLLRSGGWEGSLDEVRAAFPPIGDRGCSLDDVRKASERLGHPMQVVKADLDALEREGALPAIVLLDMPGMNFGHFMVLDGTGRSPHSVAPDQQIVTLIDPIAASAVEMPLAQFQRSWSSYAVIRKPPRPAWRAWVGVGLAAGLALSVLALIGLHPRPTTRPAAVIPATPSEVRP
jgi:hypothetical protein